MYTVTKLYRFYRNTVKIYSPDEISPPDFQHLSEVGVQLSVSLYHTVYKTSHTLDYSRLVSEQPIASATTWAIFSNMLTDEYVIGYSHTLSGFITGTDAPANPVLVWDALNTLNTFNIGYGDHLSGKHDLPYLAKRSPDLYISLQSHLPPRDDVPKLPFCLPVVNGCVCRPIYRESSKQLWALSGVSYCNQIDAHIIPEIILLDFQHVGTISTHSIRTSTSSPEEFTLTFTKQPWDLNTSWFLSSSTYSLFEYTPILCIAGILYLPDQLNIVSQHTLEFNINTQPLDNSLIYQAYLQDITDSSAKVSFTSSAISKHLQRAVEQEYSPDTFVILVHTPTLYVCRTPLDVWENSIIVDLRSTESILVRDRTATIHAYHSDDNVDLRTLTLQNMNEIYTTDQPYADEQHAIIRPDCRHHDFNNLVRGNCTMVVLTK